MPGQLALVADIGRQSVRFGLTGGDGGPLPREVTRYSTAENPTFTSALISYLSAHGLQTERLPSVLAVAGAVRGDLINLTGSRWYISLGGVEAVLREPPRAINETAAVAMSLTLLDRGAFTPLPGPPVKPVVPGGNYLVIGPGTGLGVGALITSGDKLVSVPSEAGHSDFVAMTADERTFLHYCQSKGKTIDAETLISGPGLQLAYEALSGGRQVARPEDVTRNTSRDPVCTSAMRLFVDYLGAFAGSLTMTFGAWDGVFLTGAIARALQPQLMDPSFRRRFTDKAAFRRELGEVPIAVVNRSDLELIGAAAALGNA